MVKRARAANDRKGVKNIGCGDQLRRIELVQFTDHRGDMMVVETTLNNFATVCRREIQTRDARPD